MIFFQERGLGQEVMSLHSQCVGNAGEKAWNGKGLAQEQAAELGKQMETGSAETETL